jgi:hypothetical protein
MKVLVRKSFLEIFFSDLYGFSIFLVHQDFLPCPQAGAKPDDCSTGVGSVSTPGSNAEIYSSLRGVS